MENPWYFMEEVKKMEIDYDDYDDYDQWSIVEKMEIDDYDDYDF